ncbi:hypothetical protein BJ508DRAFT_334017 [Ascobolus immersus RN42]|uniref:Uncharacterized protein n=1 Tax=Ascobolus immersus RN42 TaxID=1160509 RepID=A0A3N4HV06_ASCIM|nr:hypothetical protein BJ508DRAFT_334017 [Ascobolus immersus RN42]
MSDTLTPRPSYSEEVPPSSQRKRSTVPSRSNTPSLMNSTNSYAPLSFDNPSDSSTPVKHSAKSSGLRTPLPQFGDAPPVIIGASGKPLRFPRLALKKAAEGKGQGGVPLNRGGRPLPWLVDREKYFGTANTNKGESAAANPIADEPHHEDATATSSGTTQDTTSSTKTGTGTPASRGRRGRARGNRRGRRGHGRAHSSQRLRDSLATAPTIVVPETPPHVYASTPTQSTQVASNNNNEDNNASDNNHESESSESSSSDDDDDPNIIHDSIVVQPRVVAARTTQIVTVVADNTTTAGDVAVVAANGSDGEGPYEPQNNRPVRSYAFLNNGIRIVDLSLVEDTSNSSGSDTVLSGGDPRPMDLDADDSLQPADPAPLATVPNLIPSLVGNEEATILVHRSCVDDGHGHTEQDTISARVCKRRRSSTGAALHPVVHVVADEDTTDQQIIDLLNKKVKLVQFKVIKCRDLYHHDGRVVAICESTSYIYIPSPFLPSPQPKSSIANGFQDDPGLRDAVKGRGHRPPVVGENIVVHPTITRCGREVFGVTTYADYDVNHHPVPSNQLPAAQPVVRNAIDTIGFIGHDFEGFGPYNTIRERVPTHGIHTVVEKVGVPDENGIIPFVLKWETNDCDYEYVVDKHRSGGVNRRVLYDENYSFD